jgi:Ca2+-binding EF-hand superfamily protein
MFYPYSSQEEFDQVFDFLDFNDDGVVDADELYLAIYGEVLNPPKEESAENILNQFDYNQDGALDFTEAANAYFTKYPEATTNDFIDLWYAADLNADWLIDIEELSQLIQKIQDGVPLYPESDYQWLIDLYDQDQNGELSKAEAAFAYFTHYPWGNGYEFEYIWSYIDSDYSQQVNADELKGLDDLYISGGVYSQTDSSRHALGVRAQSKRVERV